MKQRSYNPADFRLWIIESRDSSGQLEFKSPQPESIFGMEAIRGITEDAMAQIIFRKCKDATLDGGSIPDWPKFIHPNWIARRKTW